MQIQIKNPDLEHFLAEEVRSGRFPSTEAAIEAAIARLKHESEAELDSEVVEAIERAEQQIESNQGIDFAAFAAKFRKRMSTM